MKTTYQDFPEFYENEFIKAIAPNEKWTVSDKNKVPIDMYALINEEKIWGMSLDRGYNPFVDLKTLNEILPNAANNAYYLDALSDGFVILDIEPICPDAIKNELIKMPYVYGETSMSGKGYHLAFPLPDLIKKYPAAINKLALKHENKYFEILMNHMVTFTRNVLPARSPEYKLSDFENIFELLASKATETIISNVDIKIEDMDTDNIPYFDNIMNVLENQTYGKIAEDFGNDLSRYEFGCIGFYSKLLSRLLPDSKYKDHTYTDEEKALILYSIATKKIPHRDKHESVRNGMPWLLYLATKQIKE